MAGGSNNGSVEATRNGCDNGNRRRRRPCSAFALFINGFGPTHFIPFPIMCVSVCACVCVRTSFSLLKFLCLSLLFSCQPSLAWPETRFEPLTHRAVIQGQTLFGLTFEHNRLFSLEEDAGPYNAWVVLIRLSIDRLIVCFGDEFKNEN